MISFAAGAVILVVVLVTLWRAKVTELPRSWRRSADVIEIAVVAVAVGVVVVDLVQNVASPPPWDFSVFYTAGRNASDGVSFYDPEALRTTFALVQDRWEVPADWLQEFGFWYAPPTALFLAVFGSLDYPAALVANHVVQGAFLAGAVFLLHRWFPLRPGPMGIVDMALLALVFRPVISAFDLSQIVFGALFFLVLATGTVADRPARSGLALAAGAVFKHLLLIPAVLAIALRRTRAAVAAVVGTAAICIAAGLAFGFDVYREFVSFGPTDRPPELALDPVIHSLNGVLRRLFDAVPDGPGALDAIVYWPYLVAAAVLTAVTIAVAWRATADPRGVVPAFSAVVLLALIVYPNTLYNTLPLMIPALAVLLHRTDELPWPPWATVVFVAAVYGGLATTVLPGFVALGAAWLVLVVATAGYADLPWGSRDRTHRVPAEPAP